ncbi:hypothetical protein [Herbidospora sp. RD11066]
MALRGLAVASRVNIAAKVFPKRCKGYVLELGGFRVYFVPNLLGVAVRLLKTVAVFVGVYIVSVVGMGVLAALMIAATGDYYVESKIGWREITGVVSLGAAIFFAVKVWKRNAVVSQLELAVSKGHQKIEQRAMECSQKALMTYADGSPTNAREHIEVLRGVAHRAVMRQDFKTVISCDFYMQAFDGSMLSIPESELYGPGITAESFGPRLLADVMATRQRLLAQGLLADEVEYGRATRAAMKHVIPDMQV